jgi:hypothetical protein
MNVFAILIQLESQNLRIREQMVSLTLFFILLCRLPGEFIKKTSGSSSFTG